MRVSAMRRTGRAASLGLVAALVGGLVATTISSSALAADATGTQVLPIDYVESPLQLSGAAEGVVTVADTRHGGLYQGTTGALNKVAGTFRIRPEVAGTSTWWREWGSTGAVFVRRPNDGSAITRRPAQCIVGANRTGFLDNRMPDTYYVTDAGVATKLPAGFAGVEAAEMDATTAIAGRYDEAAASTSVVVTGLAAGSVARTLWSAPGSERPSFALSQSSVAWLSASTTAGSITFNRQPKAGGTTSSVTVPVAYINSGLALTDTAALVGNYENLYVVTSAGVKAVQAPAGVDLLNSGVSDGTRLLVRGVGSGSLSGIYEVDPTTAIATKVLSFPKTAAVIDSLELTGGALWGTDRADGQPNARIWKRSISGTTVGAQTLPFATLRASGSTSFSGNRMATGATRATGGFDFYDGGTRTWGAAEGYANKASGPYTTVRVKDSAGVFQTQVRRFDGALVFQFPATLHFEDIYGSRVVWSNRDGSIVYRDLALPTSATNPRTLVPACTSCQRIPAIGGDLVAYSDNQSSAITAINVNTLAKTATTSPGSSWRIKVDDGVVAWALDSNTTTAGKQPVVAWNGVNGSAPVTVADDTSSTLFDVGDGRLAWESFDGSVRVAPVGFGGKGRPRLLGSYGNVSTFAPNVSGQATTWKPQFDVSKGLSSLTLTIAKSGTTVRTFTGGSTPTGAIRGIAWDGKNSAGALVGNGTYTWTLTGNAIDGTGAVAAINGTSAVTGSLNVATQAPGASTSNTEIESSASLTGVFSVPWGVVNQAPGTTVAYDVEYRRVTVDANGVRVYGTPTRWFTATTAKAANFSSSAGTVWQFRARAKDNYGRYGAWSAFRTTTYPVDDRGFTASGTWTTSTSSAYWLNTYRQTSALNAYLYRGSTYASKITIVGTKAPTTGKFRVYIDGVDKGIIDTYRSSVAARQLLASYSVTFGKHTVKIVNQATSGRPSIYLDAVAYAY